MRSNKVDIACTIIREDGEHQDEYLLSVPCYVTPDEPETFFSPGSRGDVDIQWSAITVDEALRYDDEGNAEPITAPTGWAQTLTASERKRIDEQCAEGAAVALAERAADLRDHHRDDRWEMLP